MVNTLDLNFKEWLKMQIEQKLKEEHVQPERIKREDSSSYVRCDDLNSMET
jgi:hypothetical protein